MKLSASDGYCYAYFPYSSSGTSITAIPVTAGDTDYMYAERVTVNDKDKNATLNMKHALAAIRFALKKGTYTGTGAVTAVSVASSALGSTGTLNAKTGAVTAANLGTAVAQSASFNLKSDAQNVDVVMVPSGNAGTITLSVTIDGKVYSTEVSSTTIKQGSCYTYTITVDAGALALSGVKVGDWGYSDSGAPVITAAGYTVTLAGNIENIAFGNSVSDNKVTITAIGYNNTIAKEVSASAGASMSQNLSGDMRIIELSNISSDVTVIFNGVNKWPSLSDGVYYVDVNGDPTETANSSCIGVALINRAKSQRLMIEKYENATNAESTTIYANAAQALGATNTFYFTWGGYGTDQSGITSYTNLDGSNDVGYLPQPDGSYLGSPQLTGTPSSWASGALSDFSGRSNSEVIQTITANGVLPSNPYAPMAFLMNAFNASDCPASVCQGFHDWYVPSCGQLGLIWLNLTAINNALTAIGGTAFTASTYWSSSEYNSDSGWDVTLRFGSVQYNVKSGNYRVRLVRNL